MKLTIRAFTILNKHLNRNLLDYSQSEKSA